MKNKKAQALGWVIEIGLTIVAIILLAIVIINGIHIETTRGGTHTGTVTAVEDNGFIWKKITVYFKTDTQSSQEDMYCLTDRTFVDTLREKEINKDKITITYNDYMIKGISNCEVGAVGIITGIK